MTISLSYWGLSLSVNSMLPVKISSLFSSDMQNPQTLMFTGFLLAPRVGLEPTNPRLTAVCSTIELSRIILFSQIYSMRFHAFIYLQNYILKYLLHLGLTSLPVLPFPMTLWSSPRPISSSQLHTLLHFHLCPIYLVVFKGSYCFHMGYLILRGASRLDAFSVYPFPTWLLCHGLGKPADTPAVSPSRSSRTKDSSSQISYAHAG